jgi:16S rRNA (cytosine1402-N4)-methyltransferase
MTESPLQIETLASTIAPTVAASCHVSVMPQEIVTWLAACQPKHVVDGTLGGGGHTRLLLQSIPTIERLIALDRDPVPVKRIRESAIDPRLSPYQASYENTAAAMQAVGVETIDAMVLDLGLSSDQLEDRERGFSFVGGGPLDLRFDPTSGVPAFQWLAQKTEKEIADAIYAYGEERFSRRIARRIVERRSDRKPVKTVEEIVDICRQSVPRSKNHDIHPATRTMQALRIVVNDELGILERTLKSCAQWFAPGGRLAIISFHSLEDRLVKNVFRDDENWNVLTKKPLRPTDEEVHANARSRSAKLRVAERR